jgi:hypothetical protein
MVLQEPLLTLHRVGRSWSSQKRRLQELAICCQHLDRMRPQFQPISWKKPRFSPIIFQEPLLTSHKVGRSWSSYKRRLQDLAIPLLASGLKGALIPTYQLKEASLLTYDIARTTPHFTYGGPGLELSERGRAAGELQALDDLVASLNSSLSIERSPPSSAADSLPAAHRQTASNRTSTSSQGQMGPFGRGISSNQSSSHTSEAPREKEVLRWPDAGKSI